MRTTSMRGADTATIRAALDAGVALLNTGAFHAFASVKPGVPTRPGSGRAGQHEPGRVPENLLAPDLRLDDYDLAQLATAFAPGAIAGFGYPQAARATVAP